MSFEKEFPKLAADGYRLTSEPTEEYNCLAWAAGHNDQWWDPAAGYYWPKEVERSDDQATLVKVYETLGFEQCSNTNQEAGVEKIALYADHGEWTHAARMLETGKWTSKLGPSEDIEHTTPAGLEGPTYGAVFCLMKRATK